MLSDRNDLCAPGTTHACHTLLATMARTGLPVQGGKERGGFHGQVTALEGCGQGQPKAVGTPTRQTPAAMRIRERHSSPHLMTETSPSRR